MRGFLLTLLVLASGACTKAVTWTGTVGPEGADRVGIRLVIDEQGDKLSGRLFFQDPVTLEYLSDDELGGTRTGTHATLTTSTNLLIEGDFEKKEFVGTITFPADEYLATPHVATLRLSR